MNARSVNAAADLICRTMKTRQTAAGIAAALDAAGMLQSPETAAELERLRARVAELVEQRDDALADIATEPDADDLRVENQRLCQRVTGLTRLLEQARAEAKTVLGDVSPWQRVVDALNGLEAAWIPVHIEPDGHISNPLGDEHIVWDRGSQRWRLVHGEEAAKHDNSADGEYRYCGADLGRDEPPPTCNRRITHDGPCGPDHDAEKDTPAGGESACDVFSAEQILTMVAALQRPQTGLHDIHTTDHNQAVKRITALLRQRLGVAGSAPALDAETCGRCGRPFDPADTGFDGCARHRDTPFCRGCVDACHESTDFAHRCPVCTVPADGGEQQ